MAPRLFLQNIFNLHNNSNSKAVDYYLPKRLRNITSGNITNFINAIEMDLLTVWWARQHLHSVDQVQWVQWPREQVPGPGQPHNAQQWYTQGLHGASAAAAPATPQPPVNNSEVYGSSYQTKYIPQVNVSLTKIHFHQSMQLSLTLNISHNLLQSIHKNTKLTHIKVCMFEEKQDFL